ncbi:hypothetical protein DFH07DRAFT_963572 [Mycena maculata]|uniref:Uncharacterized protein n=1 Tax=Mycena maculata TaxID=230809 RepID=A0AAD7N402_9AGAR|nr:hypothetical protein DFH07DRAFT_963572 [Mycena maculata]
MCFRTLLLRAYWNCTLVPSGPRARSFAEHSRSYSHPPLAKRHDTNTNTTHRSLVGLLGFKHDRALVLQAFDHGLPSTTSRIHPVADLSVLIGSSHNNEHQPIRHQHLPHGARTRSPQRLFTNRILDARATFSFSFSSRGISLLGLGVCAFIQAALELESGLIPEAFLTLSEADADDGGCRFVLEWEILYSETLVLLGLTHAPLCVPPLPLWWY